MKHLHSNVSDNLGNTKSSLDKLHLDIENTLEKIQTRETYFNRQLEPYLNEFRILQVRYFLIIAEMCGINLTPISSNLK